LSRTSPRTSLPDAESAAPPSISALAERIEALEEAVAARDDLIGLIGHELRNPLSPVFLQAYHVLAEVKRKAPGQSVDREWITPRLETFLRGLERLLDRLNRLMDVAALQSRAGITLVDEDLDFSEVVADVVNAQSREATAAASPIRFTAPGPVRGRWDRVRLEQIAGNLIGNAIRYGGAKPIDVDVQASQSKVLLTVRDRGPGVPADLQARIFNRFEQVSPRPRKGGLGLGLWVVRRLCEVMGGTISLDSQPGQGAAFVVMLPRGATDRDA
jgi:signal transduction histidine kinase